MELLHGVEILWVTDWQDGPVEGLAAYSGRECWFRAVFDPELDEFTQPRRCRLLELSDDERSRQRGRHRSWEEHAGGQHCYHDGAPDPVLRAGWWRFFDEREHEAGRCVPTVGEIGEFLAVDVHPRNPTSVPVPVPDSGVMGRASRS